MKIWSYMLQLAVVYALWFTLKSFGQNTPCSLLWSWIQISHRVHRITNILALRILTTDCEKTFTKAVPYMHFCNNYQWIDRYFVLVNTMIKYSIIDACMPQPGEIVFNTMRYRRRSETVHRSEDSVSFVKAHILFK